MASIEVRPFERRDREQLTRLVNRHVGAVLPGVAVPVNTLLSQLEREPGEQIVDPWVTERHTLVACEREAVVAGAHMLRYGAESQVGPDYRDAAEIRWLVFDPRHRAAAEALIKACARTFDEWRPATRYADGALPAAGIYGVPDCWPHVRELYRSAGFEPGARTELILLAHVEKLLGADRTARARLEIVRSVGDCGTRFTAHHEAQPIGMIEVDTDLSSAGAQARLSGWADIGNLCVAEQHRRGGVGSALLTAAARWLVHGGVHRLLAYVGAGEHDEHAFLISHGFTELARTERGWRSPAGH